MSQLSKAEPDATRQRLCRLLELPVSTSYYTPVDHEEDKKMMDALLKINQETFGTYGARRMAKALQKEAFNIGRFKTSRLMKTLGIVAKRPQKSHGYPKGKALPDIPNRLNRKFEQPQVNTHWAGDITYIRHHQGWSYLATVMDMGNKEIVGYALSQTPDAELAKQALIHAVATHKPLTHKLMFHSDQGVQYTAEAFKETLALHGITQSMSRRGNCWDNAVQERFFRNLKTEYLNDLIFTTHQAVVTAVTRYIHFYNNKRLNSAIDYLTPALKRQELLKVA